MIVAFVREREGAKPVRLAPHVVRAAAGGRRLGGVQRAAGPHPDACQAPRAKWYRRERGLLVNSKSTPMPVKHGEDRQWSLGRRMALLFKTRSNGTAVPPHMAD